MYDNDISQKIRQWLSSGEYKTELDEIRTTIMRNCNNSQSESSTAAAFENSLYYLVKKHTGIELSVSKEEQISNVNHKFGLLAERKSGTGRLDAVINNLIIEYKHHSKLTTKKQFDTAVEQVNDYLTALYHTERTKYHAVLTDGKRISYFSFKGEEIVHSSLKEITTSDLDRIVRAILANQTKKFAPKNILADFSVSYDTYTLSKSLAIVLYTVLKSTATEKTKMLYAEWLNLMHLSSDDNLGKSNDIPKRQRDLTLIFSDTIEENPDLEHKAIFALQTAYSIIVKLIACKVIDNIGFSTSSNTYYDLSRITSADMQQFLFRMEDGYSYRSSNIYNFLEGDFYSWYADADQWSGDVWKTVTEIVKTIEEYSAFSFNIYYEPIDIFKDLYMSIMPKSIRHSMGEFFTPEWLADHVVTQSIERIGDRSDWKAIDPCCGSGIFVISLIKHIVGDRKLLELTDHEKSELRNQILTRVFGIDINPLSVLSARVGYFLALQPLGAISDVEIPIYLGDSAITPQKLYINDLECYFYDITNLKIPFNIMLPVRFVKDKFFSARMNELQALVKTEQAEILYNSICSDLTDKEKECSMLTDSIRDMAENLVKLHQNHWDGIWVRIATNFMLIARLENFDIICGNPPWVKWEHLPALYAQRIKERCNVQHIFCGDGGMYGGAQLNICALIANVAAINWLKKDGVLAFLMPDSIMSQNSYEEFRNFYIDYNRGERLYLQKLDKWEAPLRPFRYEDTAVTQDFNTYYYGYEIKDYGKGVPVDVISRGKTTDKAINRNATFAEARPYLVFSEKTAVQLSPNSTAFTYASKEFDFSLLIGDTAYQYRTGVEYTPQELYMFTGTGKSETQNHYRFVKKKFARPKYKVDDTPEGGWDLPLDFIYPMLTAPNITPFRYDTSNEFCVVPYAKDNTATPVPESEMLATNRKLYTYLAGHIHIIDAQSDKSKQMHRGREFYALSKIGPYTFARYMVAARDNTRFCATVVEPTQAPWGETKQTICVKHTIIISMRKDNTFITEDEAHFICGILNSDIVRAYIHASFKTNGFSLNKSNVYLPIYEEDNALHASIVKLAKKASKLKEEEIAEICSHISDVYIKICKSRSGSPKND